jgi:hypothetical protein
MPEDSVFSLHFYEKQLLRPLSRVRDDTYWLFVANGRGSAAKTRSGDARQVYFDMLALRGCESDWLDAGTWRCA